MTSAQISFFNYKTYDSHSSSMWRECTSKINELQVDIFHTNTADNRRHCFFLLYRRCSWFHNHKVYIGIETLIHQTVPLRFDDEEPRWLKHAWSLYAFFYFGDGHWNYQHAVYHHIIIPRVVMEREVEDNEASMLSSVTGGCWLAHRFCSS